MPPPGRLTGMTEDTLAAADLLYTIIHTVRPDCQIWNIKTKRVHKAYSAHMMNPERQIRNAKSDAIAA